MFHNLSHSTSGRGLDKPICPKAMTIRHVALLIILHNNLNRDSVVYTYKRKFIESAPFQKVFYPILVNDLF